MNIVCLDLEGVLIPEIWQAVAAKTGIQALTRTTRDEPDYDKLMQYRLAILDEHNLSLRDIQDVIATLKPLPGAVEFMNWLQQETQVIILSDTFVEFAKPLMHYLGNPTLFCHSLEISKNGKISDYKLRQKDQKRKAVNALKGLNFNIIASGDSYNDLTMLEAADKGILFRPPEQLVQDFPQYPVVTSHVDLQQQIAQSLSQHSLQVSTV